jgi:hypothetical protein
MRSKLILGTAALGLAVALTGASSSAFANSQKHHDDNHGVRVLKVTLTNTQAAEFDNGTKGTSVGDRFSEFGDIVRNGKKLGVGGLECVTVGYKPGANPNGPPAVASDLCTATLALREGQISVQGLVDRVGPIPIMLPVTGGTGAYRTAHGELQTSGPNEAGDEALILRLIL